MMSSCKKSNSGAMTLDEQEDADAAADSDDIDAFLQDDNDVSFLQKKQTRSERRAIIHKVMKYLKTQAKALKSKQLSALMYKMKEDHFVKVRGMIKDMVAKLEADAAAEGDQKAWCDEEMGSATQQRDENIGAMEGDLAAKTKAESFIAKTTEEVNALMQEIADITKGLNEAQELRSKEKAENTKTIADATAGLAGVTKAMKILKDFYDNAFVQVKAHYTPSAQDKMKDMAPATFEGEMNGTVKSKEDEITTNKSDLQDFKDDLADHTALKEEALTELAKLKPACVDTGSDHEEGVARREQEIESHS